jgi:hypothetical protein
MKTRILSGCAIIALLSLSLKPAERRLTSEYEIAEIYEADELLGGSKVLLGDNLSALAKFSIQQSCRPENILSMPL